LSGRNQWLFESARLLVALAESEGVERARNLSVLRARIIGSSNKFDLFSTGTLLRWLSAGVLRQKFDFGLFLYRWSLWLALAMFCALLTYQGADAIAWGVAAGITLTVYLVRRFAM